MKQGTKEWLEFRKNKIGASDAPIIMEKSPWKTPYQLWLDKLGLSKNKETEGMRRGKRLEPIASQKFTEKTGIQIFPRTIVHKEKEWMIASLDGMDLYKKILVEIKCPNKEDHELAKCGKIPEKYFPQLQHQLEVAGLGSGYYFSFDGEDGTIIEFEKDENFVKELVKKEEIFLECILTFTPPRLTSKDRIKQTSEQWKYLAEEWIKIKKELEEKEERKKCIEEMLFDICGETSAEGGGISITNYFRRGNVEYKNIPELKNVDLEKYRKQGSFIKRISIYG